MSTTATTTRFTERQAAGLIERAETAAKAAFEAARSEAMLVGSAKSLFSDEIDFSQKTYVVNDGVCGFAWVNIQDGRSSFARQAKKLAGARKSYYGGMDIRPKAMGYSQSYERKLAACHAYAEILREAGIKAFADGRLD